MKRAAANDDDDASFESPVVHRIVPAAEAAPLPRLRSSVFDMGAGTPPLRVYDPRDRRVDFDSLPLAGPPPSKKFTPKHAERFEELFERLPPGGEGRKVPIEEKWALRSAVKRQASTGRRFRTRVEGETICIWRLPDAPKE